MAFPRRQSSLLPQAWREGVLVHDDKMGARRTCLDEFREFPLDLLPQQSLALQDVVRHA